MNQEKFNDVSRRSVLNGIGMGGLVLPLMTGTAAAEQCNLDVSVEAGEGDSDNWTRRDLLTDDFRGKIDVSGMQSGAEIAYMMMPTNPEGGFVGASNLRSGVVTAPASRGSIYGEIWNPGGIGPLGTWPSGTYTICATVAAADQEAFGVGISDPFEIDP